MGAITMSEQEHFVTYVGNHTAFIDRFSQPESARYHFEKVKSKPTTQFASLHLNLKLSEVYASAATSARLIESTTEE